MYLKLHKIIFEEYFGILGENNRFTLKNFLIILKLTDSGVIKDENLSQA